MWWCNKYLHVAVLALLLFLMVDTVLLSALRRGERTQVLAWLWFILMMLLPVGITSWCLSILQGTASVLLEGLSGNQ